jgi:hypothetical protein
VRRGLTRLVCEFGGMVGASRGEGDAKVWVAKWRQRNGTVSTLRNNLAETTLLEERSGQREMVTRELSPGSGTGTDNAPRRQSVGHVAKVCASPAGGPVVEQRRNGNVELRHHRRGVFLLHKVAQHDMSSQSRRPAHACGGRLQKGDARPTANGLQFRRSLVMTSVQILTSQPVAFAAALYRSERPPWATDCAVES